MPSNFIGTLKEIIEMPLDSNFNRTIYIATLNAVCRYLKITDNTVHCKGDKHLYMNVYCLYSCHFVRIIIVLTFYKFI